MKKFVKIVLVVIGCVGASHHSAPSLAEPAPAVVQNPPIERGKGGTDKNDEGLGLQAPLSGFAEMFPDETDKNDEGLGLQAGGNAEVAELVQRANTGDLDAQVRLCVESGLHGHPVNKVLKWCQAGAERGHPHCQWRLGMFWFTGEGVPRNETIAILWLTRAAEQGDALAQGTLGFIYHLGKGVPHNLEEAVQWYTKAAEQGDELSQFFLGGMYAEGDGVRKNAKVAVRWFTKAAEQGNVVAQYYLGVMYYEGDGVRKNAKAAFRWFIKAAERGYAEAQNNLGVMYHIGDGVPKNAKEAVGWFSKAAEQGYAEAQNNLGLMYEKGEGVPKNAQEAVQWYSKAAEQGHANAQAHLSLSYSTGQGVPTDFVTAYHWANLAAAEGLDLAIRLRDWLAERMTNAQIAEAQSRSVAFQPKVWQASPPAPTGPANRYEQPSTEGTGQSDGADHPRMEPSGVGSGFFVSTDGYLVTNDHVIRNGTRFAVVTASGVFEATAVRRDSANDLAILKVNGTFRALAIRGSDEVRLAESVATVGYPNPQLQGLAPKYTRGEISSLTGTEDDPRLFQMTVPIQPGNSGGPLVDSSGDVIGVVVSKLNATYALQTAGQLPENVNYAVKSAFLLNLVASTPGLVGKIVIATNKRRLDNTEVAEKVEKATALVVVFP